MTGHKKNSSIIKKTWSTKAKLLPASVADLFDGSAMSRSEWLYSLAWNHCCTRRMPLVYPANARPEWTRGMHGSAGRHSANIGRFRFSSPALHIRVSCGKKHELGNDCRPWSASIAIVILWSSFIQPQHLSFWTVIHYLHLIYYNQLWLFLISGKQWTDDYILDNWVVLILLTNIRFPTTTEI